MSEVDYILERWRALPGRVVSENSGLVAHVPRPKGAGASALRDARANLMAAAPDLLAACEAMVDRYERHQGKAYRDADLDAMHAAIAKAQGQEVSP